MDTGTIGPVTVMPEFTKTFGYLSSTAHGAVVSSILIPAASASFFAGHLADKVGRPRAMALGGFVFGLGAALEAGAVHLAMLIIGRAIAGVGEGLYLSTIIV
jgi:DNA-directed RNA polymerase III subunit RPC2